MASLIDRYDLDKSNNNFFIISTLGFIISLFLTTSGYLEISWGISFIIVFLIMIISSLVAIYPTDENKKL